MKKFAKILAILLSVCVLCGIAVISVNAATTAGAANEFLDASKLDGIQGTVTNGEASDYDTSTTFNQDHNGLKTNYATVSTVGTGNKYTRVVPKPADTVWPSTDKFDPKLVRDYNSVKSLTGYDYTVIDIDFATESLYFNEYISNIFIGMFPNASSYFYFARIISNGNKYYLSTDNTYDSSDILLETDGVWNHLTIIIKTNENAAASKGYVYYNGNLFNEITMNLSGSNGLRIFAFAFEGLTYTERGLADYNLCVDNFAINYYADGYDDTNADVENTLTSFFKETDYKTKSLTTLNDVIYNEDYVNGNHTASSKWDDIVVNLEIGDNIEEFKSLAAAETAIKAKSAAELNGAKIYTTVDVDVDKLLPSGLTNIKIICNGASVTGSSYSLVSYRNGNIVEYKINPLDASILGNDITNNFKSDYDNNANPIDQSGSGITNVLKLESASYSNSKSQNKYYSIHNQAEPKAPSGNYGPYFYTRIASISGKYLVYDFDISEVYFDKNITSVYVGYFDNNYRAPAYIVGDDDRNNFYLSLDNTFDKDKDLKLSSKENVWNHITYVFDSSVKGKVYIFLDGEYLGQNTISGATGAFDRFLCYFDGISTTNYNVKCNINIDNISINTYGNSYVSTNYYGLDDYIGELATTNKALYDCEDVVYNKNYEYQTYVDGDYIASITTAGGTKTNYYVLGNALSAITDGATITTSKNVNNFVVPAGVDSFTVKCIDGATFSCSDTYTSADNGDGTVTYTKKAAAVDITWLDLNGNIIATSTGEIGKTVTIAISGLGIKGTAAYEWNLGENGAFVDVKLSTETIPEDVTEFTVRPKAVKVTWKGAEDKIDDIVEYWYVGSVIEEVDISRFDSLDEKGVDGWYNIQYTKWAEFVENAEASQDVVYTPVKEPVAVTDFKHFKANVTLLDKFSYNVYLKKTAGINVTEINSKAPGTVTLTDGEHYTASSALGVYYAVASPTNFNVNFTVNYNNEDYHLSVISSVSIKNYVETGLTKYTHEENPVEVKLLVNFLNYVKATYEHRGITITTGGYSWVQKIIDAHKDCACLQSTPTNEGVQLDHSDLSEYAYSFYIPTTSGCVERVGFVLYVPTDSDFKSAEITLNGIALDKTTGKYKTGQTVNISFTNSNSTQMVDFNGVEKKCDVYYSNTGVFAIYNVNEIFTLKITTDSGEKSGTFNLVEYIEDLENHVAEKGADYFTAFETEESTLKKEISDLESKIKAIENKGAAATEQEKADMATHKTELDAKNSRLAEVTKELTPKRDCELVNVLYAFGVAAKEYKTDVTETPAE